MRSIRNYIKNGFVGEQQSGYSPGATPKDVRWPMKWKVFPPTLGKWLVD